MEKVVALIGCLALLMVCSLASAVEKPCEYCHSSHMGKMVLLNADLDQLCSGCHAERLQTGEHKTGIIPSMVVKDLPLYSGKVSCLTCHDPHARTSGMLRKPASDICISCHSK
ncbi:MAG: cytochrome c3 family protein [Nitrospiraceae bacterium]|nr:cytochrome c3 family protein [Nitrospiraceae bacterium]